MKCRSKPRSGRPWNSRTEENVLKVRAIVLADRRRNFEVTVVLSDLICDKRGSVFSPMTLHLPQDALSVLQFLASNALTPFTSPLLNMTLLRATLFCFHEWKETWKDIVLTTWDHYSPDIAPCNFLLFPWMKRDIKGHCLNNVEPLLI